MASSQSNTSLPQGFSIYQPALGSQLQFFPALGSQQLDELIASYIPGPASIKEKRASVSLDFLEHAQMTGQTFKFYPVYSFIDSPATSAASSFNVSPLTSSWDWSNTSGAPSMTPSVSSSKSRGRSKTGSPVSRHQTTDFFNLPGMKIMTKSGEDVTNSASRGSKTKEQRDHAHLMRIIKACDSCRSKKIRCDPSHKKRGATQTQTVSSSKPSKKARVTIEERSSSSRPVFVGEESRPVTSPFSFESFGFPSTDGLESFDPTALANESWDEFLQFPAEDFKPDFDFFFDLDSHLSSQTSSTSSSTSPSKSPVTSAQRASPGVPGVEGVRPQPSSSHLPFLDEYDLSGNYTDFNLFSPSSSFSEDERMIPTSSASFTSLPAPADQQLRDQAPPGRDPGAQLSDSSSEWQGRMMPARDAGAHDQPVAHVSPGDDLRDPGSSDLRCSSTTEPSQHPGRVKRAASAVICCPPGTLVMTPTGYVGRVGDNNLGANAAMTENPSESPVLASISQSGRDISTVRATTTESVLQTNKRAIGTEVESTVQLPTPESGRIPAPSGPVRDAQATLSVTSQDTLTVSSTAPMELASVSSVSSETVTAVKLIEAMAVMLSVCSGMFATTAAEALDDEQCIQTSEQSLGVLGNQRRRTATQHSRLRSCAPAFKEPTQAQSLSVMAC